MKLFLKLLNSNKIILELNDNNFSNSAKANEHLNKVEQTEHLSKAEQTEYLNKAEQTYKQGLTINPNNFEINFNLGALYFNQAAEMANAANNIKSNDEFEKAKQKYNQKFKASEPYLEKALEISPADKSTLSSLKQLYVRTGETEKYNRVKATLENIK